MFCQKLQSVGYTKRHKVSSNSVAPRAIDGSMTLRKVLVCLDTTDSTSSHHAVGRSWNIHGIELVAWSK